MHHHFKFYKPYGYLSQFINNQSQRKNKKLLGELHDFPEGTMSIGRLDEKSEGLLLLTTNGKLSEQINSSKVEKEYYVQVVGILSDQKIRQLSEGVEIKLKTSVYITKPAKVKKIDPEKILEEPAISGREERHGPFSWISITLKEGKYRQIRKMTAAIGHPTVRLVRVRIGPFFLEDLNKGEAIELKENEFIFLEE